ncbi:phosphoribosylanthranilate isomerase [Neoactinobaculum massilliense]|uniref:phosphoribosylanthranilate isomerase n=1 Tax=Neoactinobaculum massilliense TaxID=2364794 RepID=UPI000F5257E9|nr:phosphoribosylanthranilate isomerase [Neoactinobaculum massilliense]
MTLVKLCGLRTLADIDAANRAAPDFVGFNFVPTSTRCIDPDRAATLRRALDPAIQAVGVFRDAPAEAIVALADTNVIQVIQLHGNETEEQISRLQRAAACPVWRAFRVRGEADVTAANRSGADLVLLDSGGGTGHTFNWELLAGVQRPYVLAGGLTPENVGKAVVMLRPYGVDTASGIETNGQGDPAKMAAFTLSVREAQPTRAAHQAVPASAEK